MSVSNIHTDKSTVFWGYMATLMSVFSGLITLPLILRLLTPEEVGVNYLFLTITGFVALFDVGFSPQIARNLTFIFSGSQKLIKEGYNEGTGEINYSLLANLIVESKIVYKRISAVVCIMLVLIGTPYFYSVTKNDFALTYIMPIWFFYIFSCTLNMYYFYLTAFMEGRGYVKRSKQVMVFSNLMRIVFVSAFLLVGFRLWSIVFGTFLYVFLYIFLSNRVFFSGGLKSEIKKYHPTTSDLSETFNAIWYNAKKTALIYLSGFFINRSNMFFAGVYLSLAEVASLGLLMQFISLISRLSENFYLVSQPEIISLRVLGKRNDLIKRFSMTMCVYGLMFIVGSLFLIFVVPTLLQLIESKTMLPTLFIVALYCLVTFLERNHATFAAFISTGNKITFLESSLIAAVAIVGFSFFVLRYTDLGLLGLVLVQGLVQVVYANWKWPYEAMKELKISYGKFISIGMSSLYKQGKNILVSGK